MNQTWRKSWAKLNDWLMFLFCSQRVKARCRREHGIFQVTASKVGGKPDRRNDRSIDDASGERKHGLALMN